MCVVMCCVCILGGGVELLLLSQEILWRVVHVLCIPVPTTVGDIWHNPIQQWAGELPGTQSTLNWSPDFPLHRKSPESMTWVKSWSILAVPGSYPWESHPVILSLVCNWAFCQQQSPRTMSCITALTFVAIVFLFVCFYKLMLCSLMILQADT